MTWEYKTKSNMSQGIRKRNDNTALTREQVVSLIKGIEKKRDKLMISFGIYAGTRVNELASLRLDKVDFASDTITVWDDKKHNYSRGILDPITHRYRRGSKISEGRWRTIQIPRALMTQLKKYILSNPSNTEYVWNLSYKTFEDVIQKWTLKILKIEKSWHCLRHTFMTLSREAGKSMEFVIKQTGDAPETILSVYSKITPSKLKEETEKPLY